MRMFVSLFLAVVLAGSVLQAQVKAIHFKKLQECLPTAAIPEFQREKPTGTTQTSMGMSTSEASVRYTSIPKPDSLVTEDAEAEPTISVSVKIVDLVSMPYALAVFSMQQDYENETEEGYEKSVTISGTYKGIEKARTSEGGESCEVSFGVANRFMVTIEIDGKNDQAFLQKVVTMTDLSKLETLATKQ